jgi:hypothetical protein
MLGTRNVGWTQKKKGQKKRKKKEDMQKKNKAYVIFLRFH